MSHSDPTNNLSSSEIHAAGSPSTMTDNNENNNNQSMSTSLSAQEQDAKTRAQVEAIEAEIKATQPLTSPPIPIANLAKLFEDKSPSSSDYGSASLRNFRMGCDYLATKYQKYRAIRGDGNCYYRAFLYALCEHLYNHTGGDTSSDTNINTNTTSNANASVGELKRIQDYVNQSIEDIVKCGYDRFAIDIFHEEMVDLLTTISNLILTRERSSFDIIDKRLNEENATSDYCVWFLRVLTSTYLKSDPDRFVHFLDDPNYFDVPSYCAREIEPMGKECAMVGVLALAEAFGVNVEIEYMDGRELVGTPTQNGGSINSLVKHSFGRECENENGTGGMGRAQPLCITLLYRPGHYDIIYKK